MRQAAYKQYDHIDTADFMEVHLEGRVLYLINLSQEKYFEPITFSDEAAARRAFDRFPGESVDVSGVSSGETTL